MKIGDVKSGKGVGQAKAKKGVSGGSSAFADQLRGTTKGSSAGSAGDVGVVETATLDGVEALLAMQEVGDETEQQSRKQAASYGEDLLSRLATIQDSILLGAISKDHLMEMARKLRNGRVKFSEPHLNQILDDIELRVEVEIAKFTRDI